MPKRKVGKRPDYDMRIYFCPYKSVAKLGSPRDNGDFSKKSALGTCNLRLIITTQLFSCYFQPNCDHL